MMAKKLLMASAMRPIREGGGFVMHKFSVAGWDALGLRYSKLRT